MSSEGVQVTKDDWEWAVNKIPKHPPYMKTCEQFLCARFPAKKAETKRVFKAMRDEWDRFMELGNEVYMEEHPGKTTKKKAADPIDTLEKAIKKVNEKLANAETMEEQDDINRELKNMIDAAPPLVRKGLTQRGLVRGANVRPSPITSTTSVTEILHQMEDVEMTDNNDSNSNEDYDGELFSGVSAPLAPFGFSAAKKTASASSSPLLSKKKASSVAVEQEQQQEEEEEDQASYVMPSTGSKKKSAAVARTSSSTSPVTRKSASASPVPAVAAAKSKYATPAKAPPPKKATPAPQKATTAVSSKKKKQQEEEEEEEEDDEDEEEEEDDEEEEEDEEEDEIKF